MRDELEITDRVHYRSYGTPRGEFHSACRAAMITEVARDGGGGLVLGLMVANPTGLFFNTGLRQDATTSGPHQVGAWHRREDCRE